ncbi:MAG: hypothetical protein U0269_00215 [Polyangiales bacterium]
MASLNKSGRSGRSKSASNAGDGRAQDEFVDVSFDDVVVVDRSADREPDRAGEPLRVCLTCGEEEPASDGACAHDEVAAFAEAPATVFEAAERVRRAMAELVKAQRALSGYARSAAAGGEAVIDERPRAQATSAAPSEPAPCAACAERAAFEARDHERARAKRKRAMSGHGQAAFAFASEPSERAGDASETSERAVDASETSERAGDASELVAAKSGEASDGVSAASDASALIEATGAHGAHNEDAGKGRRRRKSAA